MKSEGCPQLFLGIRRPIQIIKVMCAEHGMSLGQFLKGLPQIGNRMAEQIVAELAGKVGEFATVSMDERAALGLPSRSTVEEDAIAALLALGERRQDAEHLLDRAKQHNANLKSTNDYVREMLRMRTVRS